MEDNQIIQLYFNRDERAIDETDRKYGNMLFRLSMNIVNMYEDAEECRNDTYWKTWTSVPPQRPRIFGAYLMKICRSLSFNRLERLQAKKRNARIVELTAEMESCIADPGEESRYSEERLGELLSAFLGTLPEESAMMFMRRYWYGDTIAEIAERFQAREGRIKMNLHRSRKRLKEFLEKEGITV